MISIDEYLHTSFRPDCDFIDGEVRLQALCALRMRVSSSRVRIPDVVVSEIPLPDEEVFSSPPYLCIEVMSPDDTFAAMQERLDDYLKFGVPNVWLVDPFFNGEGCTEGGG